ncbi:MAG: OmpP1/FadL family transporter [Bacteriovoracia bacterium]
MNKKKLCFGFLSLCLSAQTWASVGELYGYGSKPSGLANTMLSASTESTAAFYNPALLSNTPGLKASIGAAYMHHNFPSVHSVVVSNSATASVSGDLYGDMDTDYLDYFGQIIGVSYTFSGLKNLSIGVTTSTPVTRLAYIDTGEPLAVEYFSYRSRIQRPQVYAGLGLKPLNNFMVGAGIAYATNMTATTSVYLSGSGASVSYQRFTTTVKPSVSPYAGLAWAPKPFATALVFRLENRAKVSIDTQATARFFGAVTELPLTINSSSSLYYDPMQATWSNSISLGEFLFIGELDWLRYSKFEAPTLSLVDKGSITPLQQSVSVTPIMRDIFVPKVGIEKKFGSFSARIGYYYRQSPVSDNRGSGNLVDPAKHVGTAGVGYEFKAFGQVARVDLHGQYHKLVNQRVTKFGGNEVGTSGQSKVGSPGYDVGGTIYGGGGSLSMEF